MTVYNFNLGIGWASSGVEYAQAYRAKVLRALGIPAKFIFTDMISYENIEHMTRNIGFADSEVIWMYQYFTDYEVEPTTYTVRALEDSFPAPPERVTRQERLICYHYDAAQRYVNAFLTKDGHVWRAEYISGGCLLRTDYFSSGRIFSEFFAPKDGQAALYLRRFYNRDGGTAYEELIEGDQEMFRLKEQFFYSKEDFFRYFFRQFPLTEDDVVIADRTTQIGQAIFSQHAPARLGVVVHADHFNDGLTDDHYILWNNYYEYDFSHARDVAFFICSTDRQRDLLAAHFRKYAGLDIYAVTIPVGSLDELRYPKGAREKHSLVTASRLAPEKHVDWLVRAVAKARRAIPDLTLDIYGSGVELPRIKKAMEECGAQDFVHLLGHQDMTEVYRQYAAYLTASTSEGFGLTLLEAVGSGLPMIGFDVPYGNQTFIDNERNGYLVAMGDAGIEELTDALANRIVRLFTEADLAAFSKRSYEIAEPYLDVHIVERWRQLLAGGDRQKQRTVPAAEAKASQRGAARRQQKGETK